VKRLMLALALLLGSGSALAAQTVGTLPDKSPYLDLHDGMRLGIVAGWLATGADAVGVNAKSAPMIGVRYDAWIGGPMYLTGTIFGAGTSRAILDYTKPAATRDIGTQSFALVNANVALALSLTGARSWHHFQPLINIGVGVASGPGDKEDISGYSFGTQFEFSYGAGVRYATGHNSEFRLDLNQYWWELKYPSLYRSTQGGVNAIKPNGALDAWTANTALTLGWSLRAFR
jgi:hypothetical protein